MDNNYKKYFLRILVTALSISALIGIFVFLVGDFGDTEINLLLTTLAIGGYSLTGLCSSTILNKSEFKVFSTIGMIVSFLGFILTFGAIWEILYLENIWKTMFIFNVLSVVFAHISLLLQITPKTKNIRVLLIGTIISISIVGAMLMKSILTEFNENEFYFRLLGVFSILDVLGTIATPILNRITDKKE